jgi:hypothetical protein
MNKEDIKYALKQMGTTIYGLTIDGLKMVGIILAAAAILSTILYCFVHWPWHFVGVFVVSALSGWFWMELDSARRQREWDEECRVYWAKKEQPMHEDK